ncbi:hypothetical protein C4544_05245 [candidate division WS5 bacterium]|uniref:Uncharacterized protein n=1 Tax=candidate division WS5 bacterium TaxID=2093353 RepID=A0A419DBH0_9BACT|nr:MAG: hypothetical protein C4544_05245 [candidate division WS5 bacterium]
MATYVRDKSGAFFQSGQAGTKAVNDPRTLASLMSGTTPSESRDLFASTPSPDQTDPTLTQDTQVDENSPITKFNLALMDMLKEAQGFGPSEQDFAHQRTIERTQTGKVSEMTPEELRVLSPSQQAAIRSGEVSALEPEADAIAAKIKAQDARLSNFENLLSAAKQFGGEFSKTIAPTKEIVDGYKRMIREGAQPTSIPNEIRNKVLASLDDDDWTKWREATTKEKGGFELSEGQTRYEYNPQTGKYNIVANAPKSKEDGEQPLNILDIQRYQELYPEAGIIAGDTQETANKKVAEINTPEDKMRSLIVAAKENGNDYETVVNEINNDNTIKDKKLANEIAQEIYNITPEASPVSEPAYGQGVFSKVEVKDRMKYLEEVGMPKSQIKVQLKKDGYSMEAIKKTGAGNIIDRLQSFLFNE